VGKKLRFDLLFDMASPYASHINAILAGRLTHTFVTVPEKTAQNQALYELTT